MTNINISEQVRDFLAQESLTVESNFSILQLLSSSAMDRSVEVRDAVIRVLDQWERIPVPVKEVWNDLIEMVGLYPYMNPEEVSGGGALRYEFHRSPNHENIIFHSEQSKVWNALSNGKSLILSAPTSFGKSLMIEQVVASNKYKNIVIIQPTLALLDETRIKLAKYGQTYNLILSVFEEVKEKNIFLLTAERIVDFEDLPDIDFFIIDEFYKLSSERDDERSVALNIALYKLLKKTKNFYFLGPNIYKIPDDFAKAYNADWVRSDFATVSVDVEKVVAKRGGTINLAKERKSRLFELLSNLEGQTIIYCSKPKRASELAEDFSKYLQEQSDYQESISKDIGEISEWIEENIHKDWSLIKILKNRIAFHHGSIPRHLSMSIVDLFNNGEIKYLFCTATIIEGVNTSAKNVILFDTAKGSKPIDYFDFKNISGRSGRMKKHYIGKVFQFHDQPEEINVEVDIPFFTQDKAPLELLVHLDEDDIKPENFGRLEEFRSLPEAERNLIRSNFGAPFKGQLEVLDLLKKDDGTMHKLLSWKSFPRGADAWGQLSLVVELCFDHLVFKKGGNYTAKQIAMKVSRFLQYRSVKALIDMDVEDQYHINKCPDYYKRVQTAVEGNLYLVRNWFSFILPKSLTILDNLQNYVFSNKGLSVGNYSAVAYALENRFDQDNLHPLLDYCLPVSILTKLKKYINSEMTFSEAMGVISKLDLGKIGLLEYERKLLEKVISNH